MVPASCARKVETQAAGNKLPKALNHAAVTRVPSLLTLLPVLKGGYKDFGSTYSVVINSAHFNSGRASFLRQSTLSNSIKPISIPARTSFLAAPALSWSTFLKENCAVSLGFLILSPAGQCEFLSTKVNTSLIQSIQFAFRPIRSFLGTCYAP